MADRAGVGIMTIHQFEKEGTQPRRATLEVVRRAFENAGVEFIDENGGGPGVRLSKKRNELTAAELKVRQIARCADPSARLFFWWPRRSFAALPRT